MSPLRDQRIKNRQDFSRVLSARQQVSGRYLRVCHAKGEGLARLGMVVPKRLVKNAVSRNKVRRQLSEIFRRRSNGLEGNDIVAVLKGKCPDHETANRAAKEFDDLLQQIGEKTG